jgi:excinuclease UvrABC nuclease subunit
LLLKHFKSLKRIREASVQDLAAVIGQAKAQSLAAALQALVNASDDETATH